MNKKIVEEIEDELNRAKWKHPVFPRGVVSQTAIMAEEAGEAIRAANNYSYESGSIEDWRTELIQTAAMCVRILELQEVYK